MDGEDGEGGSAFSGSGDGGLPAGCAEHGGGGRKGRSFSSGGGAVGPTRWVTRAVTVPVQLAACAVRPPICAKSKGSPRPRVLDRLCDPGNLPHQARPPFSPGPPISARQRGGRDTHHPATHSPLLRPNLRDLSSRGFSRKPWVDFSYPSRAP